MTRHKPLSAIHYALALTLGTCLSIAWAFSFGASHLVMKAELVADPILGGENPRQLYGNSIRTMYHFDSAWWTAGIVIGAIFLSWVFLSIFRRSL